MAELEDKYWVLEHIDKDGNLKTLNPSDREEDIAPALEDLKVDMETARCVHGLLIA